MVKANDYASVMGRKAEIMLRSVGIDYSKFESGSIAFDYEKMMKETGYTLEEMQDIQYGVNVGNTPLLELKNLTALANGAHTVTATAPNAASASRAITRADT